MASENKEAVYDTNNVCQFRDKRLTLVLRFMTSHTVAGGSNLSVPSLIAGLHHMVELFRLYFSHFLGLLSELCVSLVVSCYHLLLQVRIQELAKAL